MRVCLPLAALALIGAICASAGLMAPAVWLISAALMGLILILLYALARMFSD